MAISASGLFVVPKLDLIKHSQHELTKLHNRVSISAVSRVADIKIKNRYADEDAVEEQEGRVPESHDKEKPEQVEVLLDFYFKEMRLNLIHILGKAKRLVGNAESTRTRIPDEVAELAKLAREEAQFFRGKISEIVVHFKLKADKFDNQINYLKNFATTARQFELLDVNRYTKKSKKVHFRRPG